MFEVHHPFVVGSPPTCMIELMECSKMAKLGFTLAIAALFGVDTGFPLSPTQCQLLLHCYNFPESYFYDMVDRHFPNMSDVDEMNWHEGLAVERVRAAQRMSLQILPQYFEWHELSLS